MFNAEYKKNTFIASIRQSNNTADFKLKWITTIALNTV